MRLCGRIDPGNGAGPFTGHTGLGRDGGLAVAVPFDCVCFCFDCGADSRRVLLSCTVAVQAICALTASVAAATTIAGHRVRIRS